MTKSNLNITTRISVDQLGLFFELIPIATCITTVNTSEYIYINKYFEKLFVCKRINIIGKKSNELNILTSESRDEFSKKFSEIGVTNGFKTELVLSNSKKINVIIAVEKIELNNQHFYVSTITDVTEKLKSSKEIKILNKELAFQNQEKTNRADELGIANIELEYQKIEKQNRADELGVANIEFEIQKKQAQKQAYSRSLIEAIRDPLFTINTNGKITDVNKATTRVTGVSENDLIGSYFYNYFTEPSKAKKTYQEVFKKGFVSDCPLKIKDNQQTDVLFSGSVYKDENQVVIGAVVIARDITEQIKGEQNLREYKYLFNENFDFACIANINGFFEVVNKSFENILGYTENELLNNSFLKFLHPDDFVATQKELLNLSKGKRTINFINRYKKKSGAYVLLEWKANYNKITGKIYAIARDITTEKALEKELTEAKIFAELATSIAEEAKITAENATKIAQDAVKSKQQFLSNMSHEIRTPMNAIIGFTKVVLKTDLSAKQKEYLSAIKMSGDALIVLINDILDLAKVDAGKMTFEKTAFKLDLSIKAMLHLFETKIQEKNLKLVTHYDTNIPEVLEGDPIRLHQIILNLVSNAVKFTTKGKITVRVDLISQNKDNCSIKFTVSDTGIGIEETNVDKIFENFQQASSGTSRLFGGTGLGLAIVKQLVEAQNGNITVASELGKGSTFSFELNFNKTDIEAVVEPEIVELNTNIKDTKILVVEDMELNQLLMKTLLDDFGFECEIAANGKIAVEKLQTSNYDIILMDLQMPEMNGFEATEYIRNTMKSAIPIIALTADVTTVDLEKCKAVGMNDYISKPVDERLLYSKLIGIIKKPVMIIEHNVGKSKAEDTVKYLDLSYLNTLTKSNPKLMTEMINAYLRQTPPLISTMKKSFKDNDLTLLRATIHKMLPSFSIMGLSSEYTEIANSIQEYASTLQLSIELDQMINKLETACNNACLELQLELNKLNK